MKIQINITKTHLYLSLLLVIVLIASFVIGQSTIDFGHTYDELYFRDARGFISSGDIQDGSINANDLVKGVGDVVALNVLSARNADAASCEFVITNCGGQTTGNTCNAGSAKMPGGFSFSSAWDSRSYPESNPCTSSGTMILCCKSP